MKAWNKGLKGIYSEETRHKMSLAKLGNIPWNKGKEYPAPWLEEHRYKKGQVAPRKGMKNSKEHNEKMAVYKRKQINPNAINAMTLWAKNNPEAKEKNRIKGIIELNKRRITRPEKKLKELLDTMKIKHISQYLINDRFLVDEYIPDSKTIIEVDGRYWHNLERVQKKDKAENAYLKKCGYKVIRVWEDQLSSLSAASFRTEINAVNYIYEKGVNN